ncbi:MAG TPA: cation:proton antiporter [Bacteroidales bacterium]|nr:cation:proton antiporter [Bacteroidales bacterium]
MKHLKTILIYVLFIGFFTLLIFIFLKGGKKLESQDAVKSVQTGWNFFDSFLSNLAHPLSVLLLQIASIILVARLLSWICKKLDQPAVIGEIAAGIVLGPSLLGLYFPGIFNTLFPESSFSNLQFLSQIGLILFMFVIGMELDLKVLKNQANEAVVVSHVSIIFPFTLGIGLAYFLYNTFAPIGVPFLSFGLFLGISMSITAFPVLARIVQEKGIHKTPVGTIAITCAAVDDITAWSLLAMVIAIVKAGSFLSSLTTIAMAIVYVVFILKLVKPFLKRIGDLHASRDNLSKPIVAIFFLVLIGSAYLTEIIGIHALFGAFMAGVIMPDNQKFKQILIDKIEDVALVLLLPLFFVYTGLRTQIGLLNDFRLWIMCGLIVSVAVIGKFGGSTIAARIMGQRWKESLTIGALMNTRGLVELVALNIGYDLGVLNAEMFTMLVIMALITTVMTAPSLALIEKIARKKPTEISQGGEKKEETYRILISFGNPEMGRVLLQLIYRLFGSYKKQNITALHLFTGSLFTRFKLDEYEKDSFGPIINESKKLNLPVQSIFKVSESINDDIVEEAEKSYDILMIGMGQSIYEGSLLGRFFGFFLRLKSLRWNARDHFLLDERTNDIITRLKIPVGILVNKGLIDIKTVLLIKTGYQDDPVSEYFQRFVDINLIIKIVDFTFAEQRNRLPASDLNVISPEGWKEYGDIIGHLSPASVLILHASLKK